MSLYRRHRDYFGCDYDCGLEQVGHYCYSGDGTDTADTADADVAGVAGDYWSAVYNYWQEAIVSDEHLDLDLDLDLDLHVRVHFLVVLRRR